MSAELRVSYDLEVYVKKLSVSELLARYWNPAPVRDACRLCPDYGKVWSCPPGTPEADEYLKGFQESFLIGVKVVYPPEVRSFAATPETAQKIRDLSYEKVKRNLLLTLLEVEKKERGSLCMGAGRCILCRRCARQDGMPCRYPQDCRYSITAFGFDFAKLLREAMGIELLWSPEGLPEYDVAVAALFVPEESSGKLE